MLGEGSQMGDKCSVKRSVIGQHCRIGSNVKVSYDHLLIWDKMRNFYRLFVVRTLLTLTFTTLVNTDR